MKKFLSIALAILLAMSAAGCAVSEADESGTMASGASASMQESQTSELEESIAGSSSVFSEQETASPTPKPTEKPTTTPKATEKPTAKPTAKATQKPSATSKPAQKATAKPTAKATAKPTAKPTPKPTTKPKPTPKPTEKPSISGTYYWTPNGKSYHSTRDCTTLKRSKTILSGTLDEAKAAGKYDPCNVCIK